MSAERPTRATTAGRAYLELQQLGQETGRPTSELLQLYALECIVARITRSAHSSRLILKGGLLLAAFSARRPTQDLDLAARIVRAETRAVLALIKEIAELPVDDGVTFDTPAATAESIREQASYSAVRVSMPAQLSRAKLVMQVDVTVGDPIAPDAMRIEIPRLLGGSVTTLAYPLTMVVAEKLVTALERGNANTRFRDFVDVAILARRQAILGDELLLSLRAVATHRGVVLAPLSEALAGYAAMAAPRWAAWRRKHVLDDRTPADFDDLLAEVLAFGDPAMSGRVAGLRWDPSHSVWL